MNVIYFLLILHVDLFWMLEARGSKRKAKNFKDEEYYISSVPTNRVCYNVLLDSFFFFLNLIPRALI